MSASIRLAAEGTLREFAEGLAKAHVPAGIVVAGDLAEEGSTIAGRSADGRVTLATAIEMFNASHPHYRASEESGLIEVRPQVSTACDAVLLEPIAALQVDGSLAYVLQTLAHTGNPTVPVPVSSSGQVGSVLSEPGQAAPIEKAPAVSLSFGGGTFADALDAVVQALPGSVWLLEEREVDSRPAVCQLRVVRKNSETLLGFNLIR